MSQQLEATMTLVNEKIRYSGSLRGLPEIVSDYPAPVGDGQGYTSLELFLHSLASCAGGTVGYVVRQIMKKHASGIRVTARGTRRTQHPLSFAAIQLEVFVTSPDLTEEELGNAFRLAEETYCPVIAMIKQSVTLTSTVHLSR